MRLQALGRRASVRRVFVLLVAMVLLAAPRVAEAGLPTTRDGIDSASLGVWAGTTVLIADGSAAARDDGAADAIEVPEPGVPLLLIGLGIVGVVLAASHHIRADAVSRQAFDEWEIPSEPREGTP